MQRMGKIGGLEDIKSMHFVGARSIPKAQRSTYLDLYILSREKERLNKELYALSKRKKRLEKRVAYIAERMEKLEKEVLKDKGSNPSSESSNKPFKKVSMNY